MKHLLVILFSLTFFFTFSQSIDRQKAGWLYLLANNVNWPKEPDEYVLRVITKDRQLASEIKKLTEKRQINGKPIKVIFSSFVSIPKGTHVLYITEQYKEALPEVIAQIGNEPVLVFTEKSSELGYVMFNLVESSDGLSFQYNRPNILNQNLMLRSGFDDLDGEEIKVAALYNQSKKEIAEISSRSNDVKNQIDSMNMLTAVAMKLGSNLLDRVDKTQAQLNSQQELLVEVKEVLLQRELQLEKIAKDISVKKKNIAFGEDLLDDQRTQISQREKEIVDKERELRSLTLIIENQSEILIFLIVFAVSFVFAVFAAYIAYKNRRKDAKLLNEQRQELDELLQSLRVEQAKLIQAEKLATVGALSDGITHEVSNGVNYMLSGIYVLNTKFSKVKEIIKEVEYLHARGSDFNEKLERIEILKKEIEATSYEGFNVEVTKTIMIGAKRVMKVLKKLKSFSSTNEFTKFGLAFLGGRNYKNVLDESRK